MDKKIQVNGTLILREIAGEYVLIPTGETALKINGMISLSESGAMLWSMLEAGCLEDELVKAMLETYEIDVENAKSDIADFLNQFRELDMLKEA